MRRAATFMFCAASMCCSWAQTPDSTFDTTKFIVLSGTMPDRLPVRDRPYLVTGDLYVSPGATAVIDSGVVLLFRNFTGLRVQGALLVNGAEGRPVVFTSAADQAFVPSSPVEPAPYDWNGIDVMEDAAGTRFSHCRVLYSVYGIRSLTKEIRINAGVFRFNGKSSVSVLGETQAVGGEPYSYGQVLKAPAAQETLPAAGAVPQDPRRAKRNALRYVGLGLAVAGAGVAVWAAPRFFDARDELSRLRSPTPEDKVTYGPSDFQNAQDTRNTNLGIVGAGAGLALLGAVGFVLSFTF